MRCAFALATLATAGVMAFATPSEAATCKAAVSAKSTSTAQGSDATRQSRARRAAIASWRTKAQQNYGIAYRFWLRAQAKSEKCTRTPKSATCTVSAKPCRLI